MIVTDSVIWNNNNNTWNRKECMQLSRLIIKFIDWMKLCIDFQWLIFFRRSCAMSESSSNFLLRTTKEVLLLAAVTLSFVPYPSCSARPRMLFAWAASFAMPFWDNTKGRMVPFGVGIVSMRESLRQSAAGSVHVKLILGFVQDDDFLCWDAIHDLFSSFNSSSWNFSWPGRMWCWVGKVFYGLF